MEQNNLFLFLSTRAIELHKKYIEDCRLRLSILGKSGYKIEGKSYQELCRARFGNAKSEVLSLSREIYLHEIYFDSFAQGCASLNILKLRFGSLASFLYTIECEAMESNGGFLTVSRLGDEIVIGHSARIGDRFRGTPILALDLCEHAYFLDYGFDNLSYVRAALSHLDTVKLDKI